MTDEQTDDATRDQGLDDEQRREPASGQKAGPPGNGPRDEEAVREGAEQLEQAGGGH